ncbi:MAG: cysteine desulfurase [Chloroflexi bacterium]|nr:cysteine desulfurase [Chloroflexota bacterium]
MAIEILKPATLNVEAIRLDFPILARKVNDQPLVYLDNAATSQKPDSVIQSMDFYYRNYNANVHRGIHRLSEEATLGYERSRARIANFIGARSNKEVIFTRNTTEGLNLLAYTWGESNIRQGEEILLTEMEHHSNLVPWQRLAKRKGARVRYIPVDDQGCLRMDLLDELLGPQTRLVSVTHMSNVLGTINPVAEIATRAHAVGAVVIVDAAQSVPHFPVNVRELGADFLAFSSHKMCGPTGIGALWGRRDLLEAMEPFMGGGDMIREVTYEGATWNDLPWKFEAGTPGIAEGIGFGAAVDYLSGIGMEKVHAYEQYLVSYAIEMLRSVPGVVIYGPEAALRGGVVAFNVDAIHPHDLASMLDREGIAIRAGHHCAMPLAGRLNVAATARASFYFYNTTEEIDRLVAGLYTAKKVFKF